MWQQSMSHPNDPWSQSLATAAHVSRSFATQPWNGLGPDGRLVAPAFPQAVRTTIHVDSRDRNFGAYPSSSSFVIKLPEKLKNVTGAALVSAELPLSYYVFTAARGNTTLRAVHNGVTKEVVIPDGNYSTASMCAALKAGLEAAFSGVTFTVAIDATTSKCSITASTGVLAIDTTGATKATEWGLGYYLGFPRGEVVGSGTARVTGRFVASLNPENYLLLDITELNGISQSAMYGAGGGGARTFAKVTLDGDSYSYNYFDRALTPVDRRPQVTQLDQLTVSIRFHDGSVVDLNGGEWSMSLEFWCALTRMP